jgi:hypothetical protein
VLPNDPKQRGRRSRRERLGGFIALVSVPIGLAWTAATALPMRFGYLPSLNQILLAHHWAIVAFLPQTIILPCILVGAIMNFRARRDSVAHLIKAQGQLCLACRYPLTTPAGACPECGQTYDQSSLKRGWCRTYRELAYEIDWPSAMLKDEIRGEKAEAAQ